MSVDRSNWYLDEVARRVEGTGWRATEEYTLLALVGMGYALERIANVLEGQAHR